MWLILKGLYYSYKVRGYEKAIQKCTAEREKLKQKQAKYSDKYTAYFQKAIDNSRIK